MPPLARLKVPAVRPGLTYAMHGFSPTRENVILRSPPEKDDEESGGVGLSMKRSLTPPAHPNPSPAAQGDIEK